MEIPVVENVLKVNDEIAARNRRLLGESGVFTVNLMGSPGCGKTALLEKTLEALGGEIRCGVLTGDLTTTRDAERIAVRCRDVVQINTGKGCHLDANQVGKGLEGLPLADLDVLFIENVGNLICPVGYDVGQDAKVGMFSLPEGDDKPAKHPYLVLEAALLVLAKTDLAPHVPFDRDVFFRDVRRIREDLPVLELSTTTGDGLGPWLDWVRESAARAD
jgi:hydrogenase nickel incorporation protein HypB